jgi:hypothetical protein
MTNVFSSQMLSHRLKGKWSLRQRQGFHSIGIIYPSLSLRITLHFGKIFTHIHYSYHWGESKRAHISLTKYPFLAIHAKGGESISPKQKGRTTPISKFSKQSLSCFQLVSLKLVFL